MMTDREIGVEIKSTLNLPSLKEMRADVMKLRQLQKECHVSMVHNEQQIEAQRLEKSQLLRFAEGDVDDDGIRYSSDACREAACRCDKHIGMFQALIEKEQAKVDQLEYMIREVEKRICLSERMLKSTGN